MTDPYWRPPGDAVTVGTAAPPPAPGWPGQPGMPTYQQPPGPPQPPKRSSRMAIVVGATAIICTLIGAVVGAVTGVAVTRDDAPAIAAPTEPRAPTAEQVDAQTRDLCTRFLAAFAILPLKDPTGLDLVPVVSYARAAVEDNPAARPDIRDAIGDWVREGQDWVTVRGNETPRGFIDYPEGWTVDAANVASRQAVALCRAGP